MSLETKTIIFASGHYLTETLPENIDELEEEQVLDIVASTLWQPFEYHDPSEVLGFIHNLAGDLRTHLAQGAFDD